MTIKFSGGVKHDRHEFLPGPALAFEGDRVEEYFINCGWAAETSDPPERTYSADEVVVDPATVFGSGEAAGQPVLAVAASGKAAPKED